MGQDTKQTWKVAWWEVVVTAAVVGMFACVWDWLWYAIGNASYSMTLIQMRPWPMMLVCVCCAVLAWGLRRMMASEARMGLALRAATLIAVAVVVLMTAFGVSRNMLIMNTPFACCAAVLWLACYLCSRANWWQSLKSAWQAGCMVVMWFCSVMCLIAGFSMLKQTVEVAMSVNNAPVVTSPYDWQAENEGKWVRVQGFLETDDVLEIPEWGIRHNALYIHAQPLKDSKNALALSRKVSAKNFKLGQYKLAGVQDFSDFMKINGMMEPWPAPCSLPEAAVTALPPGWKEENRYEGSNTLYLHMVKDEEEVSMEFSCYPCAPLYNVVVQGRQRGDTLQDVQVLRSYQRDTTIFDADPLQFQSWIPRVVICFFIALVFYWLGGSKGHSPLISGCPALSYVFLILLLLSAVTQAIFVPSCAPQLVWCGLAALVYLFINVLVQRRRRKA